MKNEAVVKVNRFGKVGTIIAKILRIVMMIGAIGILVGAIVLAVIPKNIVKIRSDKKLSVTIDTSVIESMSEEEKQQWLDKQYVKATADAAALEINDEKFVIVDTSIEGDNLLMDAEVEGAEYNAHTIIPYLLLVILGIVATIVIVVFAQKLCESFRDCETPFSDVVIKRMKNLSIALIPWAVINGICESSLSAFVNGSDSITLGLDLGTALVVLIIIALTFVFKYGAELQRQSDETL